MHFSIGNIVSPNMWLVKTSQVVKPGAKDWRSIYWPRWHSECMDKERVKNWTRKKLFTFIPLWALLCSDGKESFCNAGDLGSATRLGRSSGQGNGNPF